MSKLLEQILWAKTLTYEGEEYEVRWRKVGYTAESLLKSDAYLQVRHAKDANQDITDEAEKFLLTNIRETRIAELQQELNITKPTHDPEVAWSIIQRVWAQEYMGQWSNSYFFMHFELAAIMKLDELEAMVVVENLHSKQLVGFNGAIIVPFEVELEAFSYWEKMTGHKRLTMSDFGYWRCDYCGNGGDPEDVMTALNTPCTAKKNL